MGGMPNSEPPVFILTASRSGSTLLRFILDSHPDLACPPETGIGGAFAALARTWDVLENAESGQKRPVAEPVSLSPDALLAVREAVDRAFAHYLAGRQKRRWCDKSLDSFQHAELIAQVYPEAKFICLFRHCMDVIASGVEVCPWGLHRYGFDPFVTQFPGNSVAAIGSYWQTCARAIITFADKHPQACYRVRYEDLVTAPEQAAAGIFTFLGADQAPGIAEECFRVAHEGGGPGDEKIWFTTGVSARSLGRGVSVPAGALPAPLLQGINETLGELGYRVVDEDWNSAVGLTDPRAGDLPVPAGLEVPQPPAPAGAPASGPAGPGRAELDTLLSALTARLESRDGAAWRKIVADWPSVAGVTAMLVVQDQHGAHGELRLRFPATGAGPASAGYGVLAEADAAPSALMIASPATWWSVLNQDANVVTEILNGRLRCVNKLDGHRIRSATIHAVATVLGAARIPVSRVPDPDLDGLAARNQAEPASALLAAPGNPGR